MTDLSIDRRFNGPAGSGNGGYTCGLLAGRLGHAAEVTLWMPPPLDQPLRVENVELGRLTLVAGDRLVAEACGTSLDIAGLPAPPTFEEATDASMRFAGFAGHPFAECFVCGTDRDIRDGLRIFPGSLSTGRALAAPWVPDWGLAGPGETVADEFIWAALDCPAGWAIRAKAVVVLGRMAACVKVPVKPGRRCLVAAWPLGRDGRKHYAGTALFSSEGELHAVSRSTWIEIGRAEGVISARVRDITGGRAGATAHAHERGTGLFAERGR
jgi:hypothetical protein